MTEVRQPASAEGQGRFVHLRWPSHLSLRGQRNMAQREATPLPRFPGRRPEKFASELRGLSTVHPWTDAKQAGIPAGHPAGFSSTPSPLQRGGQVKSSALLRARATTPRCRC